MDITLRLLNPAAYDFFSIAPISRWNIDLRQAGGTMPPHRYVDQIARAFNITGMGQFLDTPPDDVRILMIHVWGTAIPAVSCGVAGYIVCELCDVLVRC